jgi:hypothetical protein
MGCVTRGRGRIRQQDAEATLRELREHFERLRDGVAGAEGCEGLLAAIDWQYAAWTARDAEVLAAPTAPRSDASVARGRAAAGELRKLAVLRSQVLALCRR